MLLGIVLHAALPYVHVNQFVLPGQAQHLLLAFLPIWPSDDKWSPVIAVMFQCIHIWRMPLFFMLAGFFACLVVDRYSWVYWWKNRLQRILLPIIVFSPLMAAVVPWVFQYGYIGVFQYFYSLVGQPFHLWFLWHLMLFVVATVLYQSLYVLFTWIGNMLRKVGLSVVVHAVGCIACLNPFFAVGRSPIFQSKIPIALILVCIIFNLGAAAEIMFNPLASGLYFAFGYGLYKNHVLFAFMKSHWQQYLIASAVFFVLFVVVCLNIDISKQSALVGARGMAWYMAYVALKVINSVLFSYALIGLSEAKFSKYKPYQRYLSDASYWIYLIHFPVVTLITFSMFNVSLLIAYKFIIAIVSTAIIGLMTYHYFVRSTVVGVLLHGKRLAR